ncbi:CinA family protein [Kiloniella laminariae]|uniref:CinA family protein n=1 Tax=Kiloniella laminariae TaxID=454162 RepID=A0ABT4LLT6_9PROT|nr:CinA family protein [Kiloniella laminariae]MCZ4282067.1 CinA family protein [Kiloniella laminariae]
MYSTELVQASEELLRLCRTKGIMLATAESCTGGLIAGVLTEIAGSSDVVDRGFVTYSNEAKHEALGVGTDLLDQHGAVSEAVAKAMAEGAMTHSRAGMTVAVTGIAGPGGGSKTKPVGLVYIATAFENQETQCRKMLFEGDRAAIRYQTVATALVFMKDRIT